MLRSLCKVTVHHPGHRALTGRKLRRKIAVARSGFSVKHGRAAGRPKVPCPNILAKDRRFANGKDPARSYTTDVACGGGDGSGGGERASDLVAFRSRSAYRTTVCDRVARDVSRDPVGASRPQGRRARKANSCLSLARGGFPARHTKTRENDECLSATCRTCAHRRRRRPRNDPQIYEPPSDMRRQFESDLSDIRDFQSGQSRAA